MTDEVKIAGEKVKVVEDKNKVLDKLYSSRKGFLLEYGCGAVLFGLLIAAFMKGITLPRAVVYFVGGLGVLSIGSAEYTRYFGDRYKLMNDKLLMINGIVNIRKKNVYYHPLAFVPDMNIKQSAWQKLLGYGTVSVTVSGEKFEIKNVTDPDKVLEILERKIEDSLKKGKQEENKPAAVKGW